MHPNQETIVRFYSAFSQGDAETMASCYHKDVTFSDPVFKFLKGAEVAAMWSMLCLQAKTLHITSSDIEADEDKGQANWTARYAFGKPPRPVYNRIHAEFEFLDGKIIRHIDSFNFWKWSRMALGPLGLLLGWQSGVQQKISTQAMSNLTKFITKTKTK